jgi:hypothetical protein
MSMEYVIELVLAGESKNPTDECDMSDVTVIPGVVDVALLRLDAASPTPIAVASRIRIVLIPLLDDPPSRLDP